MQAFNSSLGGLDKFKVDTDTTQLTRFPQNLEFSHRRPLVLDERYLVQMVMQRSAFLAWVQLAAKIDEHAAQGGRLEESSNQCLQLIQQVDCIRP